MSDEAPRKAPRRSPVGISDVMAVLGVASLTYGLTLIHPAAAWIVSGILLMVAGVWRETHGPDK